MKKNLLIIGAGIYGVVASEIAADMGCFDKIDFIDDGRTATPTGNSVIGTAQDLDRLSRQYDSVVVAIGNPQVRLALLDKIKNETSYRVVSLISPKAHLSPSARIADGCIVEPMAVIHAGCIIHTGCIVSAGAVVNHASVCQRGVHVDCNATIEGYCDVPVGTKICSGEVYKKPNV